MIIRFYHVVLLPDGSVASARWVDRSAEALAEREVDGRFKVVVEEGGVSLGFQGVADGGRVVCSLWHAERMVTHSVLVPGVIPADDMEVLRPYVEATIRSPLVQGLASGGTSAFEELLYRPERPLCVTVLIPVEAKCVNDAVLSSQERWVASYLPEVVRYEVRRAE